MDSWNKVRLLASAFLPRTVHVHGLATAAAMLTCTAIVLNVCPFDVTSVKTPNGELAAFRASDQARVATPVARWDDVDLPMQQPAAEPEFAARMAALIGPSPLAVAMVEAAPEATPAVLQTASEPEGKPAPQESAEPGPQVSTEPASEPARDAIIGVWAPGTCSARDFREGLLPTIINTEGAWAGETFCLFSKRKQVDAGWSVVAKCTNARERWTSHVRLTVNENRLTWTSQRGTQAYMRCAPDVLMAQASGR